MKKMWAVAILFLLPLWTFCEGASSIYDAWNKFAKSVQSAERNENSDVQDEYKTALDDFENDLEKFMKTSFVSYAKSQVDNGLKGADDFSNQDSAEEKLETTSRLYNAIEKLYKTTEKDRRKFSEGKISETQLFVELQLLVLAVARCEAEFANEVCSKNSLLVIIFSLVATGIGVAIIIYARRQKIVTELKQNMKEGRTIVRIQENERSRMYRELHDTVAQDIRATVLFSKQIENLSDLSQEVAELTHKIMHLCQRSLSGIYATISGLAPPELKGNFSDALEMLCTNQRRLTGIPCKRHIDKDAMEMLSMLDIDKKLHIYRIVQEALQNAAKHAHPSECSLIVNVTDTKILLFVTDDGTGFLQCGAGTSSRRTFGISGMKSRAELVGAQLSIDSSEEGGTEVKLEIPLHLVLGGGIKKRGK